MCKSPLHPFLARLPKCEHHMHLEGSLTPKLFFKLAERNSIVLPETDDLYRSIASYSSHLAKEDAFEDLDSFLSLYYTGMSVLRTEQDYHDLAISYFAKAAQDNVRHAEVFFDPQAHTTRGVSYDTVVAGFQSARNEAKAVFGLTSELIVCFLRHLPAADAIEHYSMAREDLLNGAISGIGLDSSERNYPAELFQGLYALANKDGVRRTAHAGEEVGPESIYGALDALSSQRIDHGRTTPQDPELMRKIAGEQILITMCPLSNLKLQGVQSLEQLPVRIFLDAGIRFSINSDDPAYFGGFIQDNYCAVQQAFDLSIKDWVWICESAIAGSWCDETRKAVLFVELKEVVDMFTTTRQDIQQETLSS